MASTLSSISVILSLAPDGAVTASNATSALASVQTASRSTSALPSVWTVSSEPIVNSTTEFDPVINFCTRGWHQSAIHKDRLYIDGGVEAFTNITNGDQTGNITIGFNNYLIEIDLTQPWDWSTNISEVVRSKTANPNTGTVPPSFINGALYPGAPDDTKVYMFGGTTSYLNVSFPGWVKPQSGQYTLWSYDTNTTLWDQYDISSEVLSRPSSGFSAVAEDQGLAFYLNGELDSGSSTQTQDLGNNTVFLPGMVVVNTTNQTAVNVTAPGFSSYMPRSRGGMVYFSDIGKHGILVAMGGVWKWDGEYDPIELQQYVHMDQISVFDIDAYYQGNASVGWFNQTATGPIPAPRAEFCVVPISAPNGTSHNIYLYDGEGPDGAMYDDVWVLSLPSFTWTQVFGPGESPRFAHTCHVVGRQMITVGGFITQGITTDDVTFCDWENKSVAVLDMSTIQWGSVFDPNLTDYTVPDAVLKTIGGANGTAPMTQPAAGFSSPQLAAIFNGSSSVQTRTSAGSALSAADIAGIVVGVIVAVVIICGLGYWWWISHRPEISPGPDSPPPEAELRDPWRGEAGG